MKTDNINFELVELLVAHGIQAVVVDAAIRLGTHPGTAIDSQLRYKKGKGYVASYLTICLTVDGRQILECFCDYGKTLAQARANSLDNFSRNCLYPLLACLFDFPATDLEVQTWLVNGQAYQVYWGDYIVKTSGERVHDLPQSLISRLEGYIKHLSLENAYHWIHWFAGFPNGRLNTTEFLLDNFANEEGENIIKTTPWPKTEGYYSIRNFVILKKMEKPRMAPAKTVQELADSCCSDSP